MNAPLDPSAVVDPNSVEPLNNFTVLPDSAIPSIVGVASFVSDVVVVIDGADGAVVSTVMLSALDAAEVFPAASVAVTVKE